MSPRMRLPTACRVRFNSGSTREAWERTPHPKSSKISRINPELERKLTDLETRWHDSQKLMDRAKYILMRNPHASRGKDEVARITKTMDAVHAEFQRVLQRQSVLGVSQTEHVLDAYCQVFRPTAWHFNVLMDSFRRHQPLQCPKLIDVGARAACFAYDPSCTDRRGFSEWIVRVSSLTRQPSTSCWRR